MRIPFGREISSDERHLRPLKSTPVVGVLNIHDTLHESMDFNNNTWVDNLQTSPRLFPSWEEVLDPSKIPSLDNWDLVLGDQYLEMFRSGSVAPQAGS